MFGIPFISSAATYHYVDIYGRIQGIEAASAQEALTRVTALDTTLHTGVALDLGVLDTNDYFGQYYEYRATNGSLQHIFAPTYDAAYLRATDRDPSSGLILVE